MRYAHRSVCLAVLLALTGGALVATQTAQAVTIDGVKSIRITDNNANWFYLEEVNLFNAGGTDVASLAFGSTGTPNFAPAFGSTATGAINDVNSVACCGNGTHSAVAAASPPNRYDIGLPSVQSIDAMSFPVEIYNRADACCPERVENVNISFLNNSGRPILVNDGSGRPTTQFALRGPASFQTNFPAGGGTFRINGGSVIGQSFLATQPMPMVTAFSSQFNAGQYAATHIVDGVIGANGDWAGVGGGPHTVDLDFGQKLDFSAISYNNRVNTGGSDPASQIELFFSDNGIFGATPNVTINSVNPDKNNNVYQLGGVYSGQYVRMRVQGAGNVGGAELQFFNQEKLPPVQQLANPAIINNATAFNATYAVSNIFDGNLFTDYASQGQGANTFIDFDFGSPQHISLVEFTDRTTSASGQGLGGGGGADNVQKFSLIFSNNGLFGDLDDVQIFYQSPDFAETQLLLINNGLGYTAQFVRWDVTAAAGANVGAAEFRFFTTVPEPATATMGLLALAGLMIRRRRAA